MPRTPPTPRTSDVLARPAIGPEPGQPETAFGGYERGWDQVSARLDRENGQWKVLLRHGDELPGKDERQR
jgi:hypothetical protein